MNGWPHPDFDLRIVDEKDGTPVMTIHFKDGEHFTVNENHITGETYTVPLEIKS